MGMSVGGSKGYNSEPNMVPMIDILLVLLIIFMLIIPMGRKAFDVQLPDPTAEKPPPNQKVNQIVLEVLPGEQYLINKAPVAKAQLFSKLKEIYDPRPEKIIFLKGDPEVKFQEVIFGMDQARGAGVRVIGATPRAPAGAAK
ncbi:MAG: biopolymer transporter ExbD [Gemmatimonadetes bacterium]|nr:biopolymer transporter ExbD [Gemmatimonadota bacterium]